MATTEDKLILYGAGALVVYFLLKNSLFKPITTITDAVTADLERAVAPFASDADLHTALTRAGFSYTFSQGVTYVRSKDGGTTWMIRSGDLNRTEYIKRRLDLAIYTPGSDSWVFA